MIIQYIFLRRYLRKKEDAIEDIKLIITLFIEKMSKEI